MMVVPSKMNRSRGARLEFVNVQYCSWLFVVRKGLQSDEWDEVGLMKTTRLGDIRNKFYRCEQ